MKNASIKEMIRKQKMDAIDRKDLVSEGGEGRDWERSRSGMTDLGLFCVGNSGKEAAAAEQADQQHFRGK